MNKVAVIGSRTFTNYDLLERVLNEFDISKVISGGAQGADRLAAQYAKQHKIDYLEFKPDWKKYGRGAGPIRNREIVDAADVVIAFWDGKSKGTKSGLDYAKRKNKEIMIQRTDSEPQ